jgi:hypothetical protein
LSRNPTMQKGQRSLQWFCHGFARGAWSDNADAGCRGMAPWAVPATRFGGACEPRHVLVTCRIQWCPCLGSCEAKPGLGFARVHATARAPQAAPRRRAQPQAQVCRDAEGRQGGIARRGCRCRVRHRWVCRSVGLSVRLPLFVHLSPLAGLNVCLPARRPVPCL